MAHGANGPRGRRLVLLVCLVLEVSAFAIRNGDGAAPSTAPGGGRRAVPTLQAYRAQRARSIQSEASAALGGALCATFTPAEVRADSLLRAAKASALALPGPPLPAQHFFDAKPRIEGLELFALLRKMPKGAALHVHSDSMADLTWLVANATYDPRLWLCGELTGASEVSFLFTEGGPPSAASQCSAGHGWRQVTALRGISGMSPAQFDALLLRELSLVTPRRPAYISQAAVWKKFQGCLGVASGLIFFQEVHARYLREAMSSFLRDGVTHLELRQVFQGDIGKLYTAAGATLEYDDTLAAISEAAADVGLTVRVIVCGLRASPAAVVAQALRDTARLKAKFPSLVAGFDLVGQEDAGKPLSAFLPQLLQPAASMPYFFHAGETDEVGEAVDLNLFDALLLNSSRVGHGFGLARHPSLRRAFSKAGLGVEVCPLSNQVLLLVADLRNHPLAGFVAEDLPLTVNPDDPALWGAEATSYDWLQFFLASGNQTGLGMLKQLAVNSWTQSALDEEQALRSNLAWEKSWAEWVVWVGKHARTDNAS